MLSRHPQNQTRFFCHLFCQFFHGALTGLAGKAEHNVGAAIGQHADPGINIPACTHIEHHTLRPVLLPDFIHLFFNQVKGLDPGDALPFAFTALAGNLTGPGNRHTES